MVEFTRRRVKRRHTEAKAEMTVIVRTTMRVLLPIVLVFSIYNITYGHLTPGGAFQGGIALVGAVMSFYLAYGYEMLRGFTHEELDLIEHITALAYLAIGLLGLVVGTRFLSNLLKGGTPGYLFSGGVVFLFNLIIGVMVAAGTLLVLLILLGALQKGEPWKHES
jgi:multicomponent Na+:H+ antiporter subunit B